MSDILQLYNKNIFLVLKEREDGKHKFMYAPFLN